MNNKGEIRFYFIEGLDTTNTFIFYSEEEKQEYFDSLDYISIEGYYPPFYKNQFKVSLNEISQIANKPINYLSIYYPKNEKVYYYFINNIDYLNEDTIMITISMDSIITYGNNILVRNYDVERNNIFDNQIIRENLSKSDSKYNIKSYYQIDNTLQEEDTDYKKVIIARMAVRGQNLGKEVTMLDTDNAIYPTSTYTVVIPFIDNYFDNQYLGLSGNIRFELSNGSFTISGASLVNILNYLVQSTETISLKVCYIPKKFIDYTVEFKYDHDSAGSYYSTVVRLTTPTVSHSSIATIKKDNKSIAYGFQLVGLPSLCELSNTAEQLYLKPNINTPSFNENVSVYAMDSNYIDFSFGTYTERAHYEFKYGLSDNAYFNSYNKQKDISPIVYTSFDFTSCNSNYAIVPNLSIFKNEDGTFNNNAIRRYAITHNLLVTDNNNLDLPLITDAWNNYVSQNMGSLTTGIKLQQHNAVVNQAQGSFNAIASGTIKGASGDIIGGVGNMTIGTIDRYITAKNSWYNIDQNLKVLKENLQNTPDTVNGAYNYSNSLNMKYSKPFLSIAWVDDIIGVAKKYYSYGWLKNISYSYYTPTELYTILDYDFAITNRQKVNTENIDNGVTTNFVFWKLDNIDFYISNTLMTNEIMRNIKERFNKGLRIFKSNIDNPIVKYYRELDKFKGKV